jgi:hypothetical protein
MARASARRFLTDQLPAHRQEAKVAANVDTDRAGRRMVGEREP